MLTDQSFGAQIFGHLSKPCLSAQSYDRDPCAGMRLVGGPKPTAGAGFNFGNNAVAVSIHEEQELKSIQKELKEAIEKEDFDMAKVRTTRMKMS